MEENDFKGLWTIIAFFPGVFYPGAGHILQLRFFRGAIFLALTNIFNHVPINMFTFILINVFYLGSIIDVLFFSYKRKHLFS